MLLETSKMKIKKKIFETATNANEGIISNEKITVNDWVIKMKTAIEKTIEIFLLMLGNMLINYRRCNYVQ